MKRFSQDIQGVLVLVGAAAFAVGCATTSDLTTPRARPDARIHYHEFQTALPEDAAAKVERLAEALEVDEAATLLITGHAYDWYTRGANFRTAERRAETAKAVLVEKGIDPSRITADSRGDSDPRIRLDNFGRRLKHNRIELYVRKPEPGPSEQNATEPRS